MSSDILLIKLRSHGTRQNFLSELRAPYRYLSFDLQQGLIAFQSVIINNELFSFCIRQFTLMNSDDNICKKSSVFQWQCHWRLNLAFYLSLTPFLVTFSFSFLKFVGSFLPYTSCKEIQYRNCIQLLGENALHHIFLASFGCACFTSDFS